ncbi:WXG100 family type VII secretion target [Saccharopolyspora griseoalba]|uniref:WXG100 family type VII secretion target n=1 Tax=Saccharopolyspora griseoalba TaxID=1431848 RepID=A0ABW2LMM0_9PSEU
MSSMFVDTGELTSPSWSSSKLTAGAGPLDSIRATVNAVNTQDWGDFAASAGVLALDGLVTVIDPVGTALAAGVGWLMEHLAPLRELLDFLAGDPPAIAAGADTWKAIKEDLQALADEFPSQADQQTSGWSGPAKDAYTKQVQEYTEGLQGMALSAGNASSVIATAGTMVATCRAIVRDIIAAIVAELVKGALAALAGSVVSFGATVAGYLAYAAGRIGMTISKITAKISQLLAKLGKAGALLARVLDDMAQVGAKVGADLTTAGTKAASTAPAAAGDMLSAGSKVSAGADALGSAATGTARASDGVAAAAGRTSEAAASIGRGSENLAGTGLRWMNNADEAGQAVAEGVGKRAQEAAENVGYRGRYHDEMDRLANVTNPESARLRGALGAAQYHEQNNDSDSGGYYDVGSGRSQGSGEPGMQGWSGSLPDSGSN